MDTFTQLFREDKSVVVPGIGPITCEGLNNTYESCIQMYGAEKGRYMCLHFKELGYICYKSDNEVDFQVKLREQVQERAKFKNVES